MLSVLRGPAYTVTFCNFGKLAYSLCRIFSISSVLGENIARSAEAWLQLVKKGELTYYCSLGEAAAQYHVDEAFVRGIFHFIRIDWNTGET